MSTPMLHFNPSPPEGTTFRESRNQLGKSSSCLYVRIHTCELLYSVRHREAPNKAQSSNHPRSEPLPRRCLDCAPCACRHTCRLSFYSCNVHSQKGNLKSLDSSPPLLSSLLETRQSLFYTIIQHIVSIGQPLRLPSPLPRRCLALATNPLCAGCLLQLHHVFALLFSPLLLSSPPPLLSSLSSSLLISSYALPRLSTPDSCRCSSPSPSPNPEGARCCRCAVAEKRQAFSDPAIDNPSALQAPTRLGSTPQLPATDALCLAAAIWTPSSGHPSSLPTTSPSRHGASRPGARVRLCLGGIPASPGTARGDLDPPRANTSSPVLG